MNWFEVVAALALFAYPVTLLVECGYIALNGRRSKR